MPPRIGIVGCGAIGASLARFIHENLRGGAFLQFLFDADAQARERLLKSLKLKFPSVSVTELVRKSDFVIEAASISAAREIIPLSLKYGKPALLMSGGGLVREPKLLQRILKARVKFYLPSGAVGAVDALLASREAGLKKVSLTTSKSLKSLSGAPFFEKFPRKKTLRKPSEVIFEGNVSEAIRYFPKNLNVAALLALAGLGPQKTRVRVIAYRKLLTNNHEIEITSRAGKIIFKTENLPHPQNPRTSALAVYSAQALLRKLFSPLALGT
jgi:aspartate dehydrogenase